MGTGSGKPIKVRDRSAIRKREPAHYATLIEADEPGTYPLIWSRRNGD